MRQQISRLAVGLFLALFASQIVFASESWRAKECKEIFVKAEELDSSPDIWSDWQTDCWVHISAEGRRRWSGSNTSSNKTSSSVSGNKLTAEEMSNLAGEYIADGTKYGGLEEKVTFFIAPSGELEGKSTNLWKAVEWADHKDTWSRFQRLSISDWEQYELKSLPAESCGQDRHCFRTRRCSYTPLYKIHWCWTILLQTLLDYSGFYVAVFKGSGTIEFPIAGWKVPFEKTTGAVVSTELKKSVPKASLANSSALKQTELPQSTDAMSFHEKECKEVFETKWHIDRPSWEWGDAWDVNCWDYVTEDGKRWIGSQDESSTAAQVPTTKQIELSQSVETKKLDLEFWQSIKDSDDVEMYQAYLSEFPRGKFKKLAKLKLKKLGVVPATASIPNLDYGRYHALVIGNNDYENLPDLETAVSDARRIASVLEYDYGFDVKLLKNATRLEIIKSLSSLRKKIRAEDNLLIYYAGHGNLDKKANEGYWLPTDAERGDPGNWIANDMVVSQVRAMDAKHVMVVADSCFSGTITRGLKIEQRTPDWLQKIVRKKARTALTSGGLEPVMDSGGGNHSAFASAFISLLEENDGVLDASQLFSQLRPKVMVNSPQTPEYGNIHQAGHDGGDFLFVRQ